MRNSKGYVLATTHNILSFYQVQLGHKAYVLHERLDLNHVTVFGDKKSAKQAALGMDLQTWRYIRL